MSSLKEAFNLDIPEILDISGGYYSERFLSTGSINRNESTLPQSINTIVNEIEIIKDQKKSIGEKLELIYVSDKAQKIIRAHYIAKILPLLEWISNNHIEGKPNTSLHFSKVFSLINKLYKENYNDPFSSYLLALNDGLSFKDAWVAVERDVYKKVVQQLKSLMNKDFSDYKQIDKAILDLEKFGINTTPF